jgi:signal transduction histidine kinase
LGQVLIPLLHHIGQHSFVPGVAGTITLSAERRDAYLLLHLADDGAGLDPDVQGDLFAPLLRRSDAEGARPMGMAIVDNLVRKAMGGSIRMVSVPGPGLRFEIRLPLSPSTLGPASA